MTTMLEVVETTYQQAYRGYVYRFREVINKGVTVSRVPESNQLWTHSIVHQYLNPGIKAYKPAVLSDIIVPIATLDEAVKLAFEVADQE